MCYVLQRVCNTVKRMDAAFWLAEGLTLHKLTSYNFIFIIHQKTKAMKKYLLLVGAVVAFASCTSISKTARTESIPYAMYNANVADLEVGDRVSYTMTPSKSIRRAGDDNVKKAAIQEVLVQNGNADLLVEPQFVISKRKGMFGTKITSITVTGRPAKYKNFRSLDDKVWTDPVFRGHRGTNLNIYKGVPMHPGACPLKK